MTEIQRLVNEWLALDQDEETRSEILALVDQLNYPRLKLLLGNRLTFGTAGLRASMEAGYARLNSLTIIQTSQGLAEYVLKQGLASQGVVIGYDARRNSKKFAELAAAAFMAKEIPVYWYENIVHTPMVPFAVKTYGAAAGVMITASHNPKDDNGYKVYGSNGCQINSPVDSHIAASILKNLKPVTWTFDTSSPLLSRILNHATVKYVSALTHYLRICPEYWTPSCPAFAYTPMHGVGFSPMTAVLRKLNLESKLSMVYEQLAPDPNFPTVHFPNPEEDGALDLAKATADREGVRLVIANDPDADRFAAAEKVDGQWIQLTGDQVGVLLAQFLIEQIQNMSQGDWMLTTAVSSQMLSAISKDDFRVYETLTGFKWMGNEAVDLRDRGQNVHFAYEEALGYMFPEIVYDKDGIAAAVVFLAACTKWASPWAKLQQMYKQYGYFETMNTYWRTPDLATTVQVFNRIRSLGKPYPTHVAGRKVQRWRDLTTGYDSSTADNKPKLPSSTSSQMITCWQQGTQADDGIRFTVRASGTEPKIKIYLECQSKDQAVAQKGASEALRRISREWFDGAGLVIEEKHKQLAGLT
ncbi:Phosphoglucomutase-3 [Puttea exsequens]|nr:Phosphoglucomutase-3 [Puttea exsequens]